MGSNDFLGAFFVPPLHEAKLAVILVLLILVHGCAGSGQWQGCRVRDLIHPGTILYENQNPRYFH